MLVNVFGHWINPVNIAFLRGIVDVDGAVLGVNVVFCSYAGSMGEHQALDLDIYGISPQNVADVINQK